MWRIGISESTSRQLNMFAGFLFIVCKVNSHGARSGRKLRNPATADGGRHAFTPTNSEPTWRSVAAHATSNIPKDTRMPFQPELEKSENYNQFQDAFSSTLIDKLSKPQRPLKSRKKPKQTSSGRPLNGAAAVEPSRDAEELADFTDYIASLTFDSLPVELQTITHQIWANNPTIQEKYSLPLTSADIREHIVGSLDATVSESLITYGIITPPAEDVADLLAPVLTSYLAAITTPPPTPVTSSATTTRGKACECELCERDWVPLTYHHLIPRFVHAKAVKRGWHREEDLQNVAWLCRACHSFVHRFAGHEELAREYFTVERLLEQEEIRDFARWVSRVRWKAR